MTKTILLTAMLLSIGMAVFAQGDPGGNPDEDVPLDGGIVFLAAAGAMYGAKKLKDIKNRKQTDSGLKSE